MRRSISALGGALITLTLVAGPAWAGPPGKGSAMHYAVTGLGTWLLIGAAAWLVASGLALLVAGSFFRGAHARQRTEDGRFAR